MVCNARLNHLEPIDELEEEDMSIRKLLRKDVIRGRRGWLVLDYRSHVRGQNSRNRRGGCRQPARFWRFQGVGCVRRELRRRCDSESDSGCGGCGLAMVSRVRCSASGVYRGRQDSYDRP